eukprot:4678786-Pyramimonas_sp.AAC.1
MGPRSAVFGGGTHAGGGAPFGATKHCTGWGGRMRASVRVPSRVPYRAMMRCTWWGGRMRAVALGPSVELPMGGPRSAALDGGTH